MPNFQITLTTLTIPPVDRELAVALQARIDSRTKPPGSLGQLEKIALQIGLIQQTGRPAINRPCIAVFAGDHGAATAGVSPFPQAVTAQMVANFLNGGAAINVLARLHDFDLYIVDAGVANPIDVPLAMRNTRFISARVADGTDNYLERPAMTMRQCETAIARGAQQLEQWRENGCNAIGFGEMGIGNTASSSLITHFLCQAPLEKTVGRGSGHDEKGVSRKLELLRRAAARVAGRSLSPLEVLAEFGGFEIAMMTGAYLAAAQNRMLIVVDGFIGTAALLVAHALQPHILDYCVFAHGSAEPGHRVQLQFLQVQPLLDLGLCLGEGSGAALAFPLLRSAVALMNEMAGFDDARISTRAENS